MRAYEKQVCNVFSSFVSTTHLSMNLELLELGSGVFYGVGMA